jgi:hypothetical protein
MFHKCSSWYTGSSHNCWICILLKYNSFFFRHNFNSKLQMLILLFWNSTWWCWWWCVYLCFDWSKCHDLTWGIEQVLICMSVTHVSYYSDLRCLHGIICYVCQVMHNKIMPCKPSFSHWVILFLKDKCISYSPVLMPTLTKNRNILRWPKLLHFTVKFKL